MDMDDLGKFNFIINQINKKSKKQFPLDRKILSYEENQKIAREIYIRKAKLIRVTNLAKIIL